MIKLTHIISHTDMDGIVSAVLLQDIFEDVKDVEFADPNDIQSRFLIPEKWDIVCDLPEGGGLWFDHHQTGEMIAGQDPNPNPRREKHFDPIKKSCARLIYETYKDKLKKWSKLVDETDKIDSASYTIEEYLNPNAYQILSITLRSGDKEKDDDYRYYVMGCLNMMTPENIVKTTIVQKRYKEKQKDWEEWDKTYNKYLTKIGKVLILDSSSMEVFPRGRVHKMFIDNPECDFSIMVGKLPFNGDIKLSVGTNIFKKVPDFNIGGMLREFGGGGHKGVGGVVVPFEKKEEVIKQIIEKLGA